MSLTVHGMFLSCVMFLSGRGFGVGWEVGNILDQTGSETMVNRPLPPNHAWKLSVLALRTIFQVREVRVPLWVPSGVGVPGSTSHCSSAFP